MSLFARIDAASAHPERWRLLSPLSALPSPEGRTDTWATTVEIDDAGPMPGFLQIGHRMPLRLGLRIPGAPGRESLVDLLRLPAPRRPPDAHAWAAGLPNLLRRSTGEEAVARLALARDLVDLTVLSAGRGGVRWRVLGPHLHLAEDPDDTQPLHARGGILLAPDLRHLLADILLPHPDVRPRCLCEAHDALLGQALPASAHARLSLEARIWEQARTLLGPRAALRLMARTRR